MPRTYGDLNPALTRAVHAVAHGGSKNIKFLHHALRAMDKRGFDHTDVLECLRKGKAHGPEDINGELRANVIHQGRRIRVSIGSIGYAAANWSLLRDLTVVTVMKEE